MSIENDLTPSHYRVLGLDSTASLETIKRAYHRLALQYHPDKATSDDGNMLAELSTKFQRVQHAWSVLQDEEARRAYDNRLQGAYSIDSIT